MATQSIQQILIDQELKDLALEIFSTSFGLDWNAAIDLAIEQMPELLDLAIEWDTDAALQALEVIALAA